MKEFIKSKMDLPVKLPGDLPVVDFRNHGPLTMDRFHTCKRRLRVREELLPLTRRTFKNQRFTPYPGYETQRPFENRLSHERNPLAVERTQQVVEAFKQSDEEMLRIRRRELDEQATGGKWWEKKKDPVDEIADDHYFDLVRLFNEELHQKFWEEEDWFNLWDHSISNESYLPMEW